MVSCKFITPAITLFLTACATPASEGDAVLVVGYSRQFQAAVAAEYAALPVSCQRADPTTPPGCSTLKTMINDYAHLRARLRAE